MAGRKDTISDSAILRQIALAPPPAVIASYVGELLDMTKGGARYRLDRLAEDGLLEKMDLGGATLYWLTPEGNQAALEADDAESAT